MMTEEIDEVALYVTFVLHAVLGRLAEADELMRRFAPQIRHVADALTWAVATPPRPVYRGLLLDPDKTYDADPRYTFMSWSESRDVARWFACPRSVVSEPLAASNPKLRGYLVEADAPARILFHYSWSRAFGGLSPLARMHPLIGETGARQVAWSLRTQREVITEPVFEVRPAPAPDLSAAELQELERRLSPPWVVTAEGLRS